MLTDDEAVRIHEHLLNGHRSFLPTPGMGENLYFASDVSGQTQVHLLSEADSNRGLTGDDERHLPVGATSRGLLVRHDTGGNEVWQLSLLGPDHVLNPVTRDLRCKHESPTISPDGRRVGLARNPNGQDDMVLSVLDLGSGEFEDWASPGGYWLWSSWSPEGERAVVMHMRSPTRLECHVLDSKGNLTRILRSARRVSDVTWLPGDRLVALSDFESEYMLPVEIDLRRPDEIARRLGEDQHDFDALVLGPQHRFAIAALNTGAYHSLQRIDIDAGRVVQHYELPRGTIHTEIAAQASEAIAWHPDGSRAFVAWDTTTLPSEIYELPAGRRLTFAAGEPLTGLVEPIETRYRSFDGLQIPALLLRVDDRPRPTVVYFHGGPESQIMGSFQTVFQLLLNAGFNVFAPNVRGSTGFGSTYFSLDDRELRWNAVRDGCEAARYLKREGLATATAAFGRSYGGFMTLAVLVEDPDLWDAAVEFVGIADWHSFLRNTSGWRRAMRIEEYGDPYGDQSEFLAEISPLRHAKRIRSPLLVIHGRNDPRVPVAETEEIAAATGAELLIFEDEGHGISRQANIREAYSRCVEFLKRHLDTGAASKTGN